MVRGMPPGDAMNQKMVVHSTLFPLFNGAGYAAGIMQTRLRKEFL